jgi:hypothetical protein
MQQASELYKSEVPYSTDYQTQQLLLQQSERDKQILSDAHALQKSTYTNYDSLSKEEATEIFKQMLRQKGIDSNWKWDDVNRIIQDDRRVKVFKTIGERKNAFSEY